MHTNKYKYNNNNSIIGKQTKERNITFSLCYVNKYNNLDGKAHKLKKNEFTISLFNVIRHHEKIFHESTVICLVGISSIYRCLVIKV